MDTKASIANILPPEFSLLSYTQIAALWSDYGHIYRLNVASSSTAAKSNSLILKSIHPPSLTEPSESHLRKLLSYQVERWFYHHYTSHLPANVKVAKAYVSKADEDGNLLLEDLSVDYRFPAGESLGREATMCVIQWLAGYHATFFGIQNQSGGKLKLVPPPNQWKDEKVEGVWKRGTYWYLETRREELARTDKEEYGWLLPWVEKVNNAIDLEIQKYGTLLHGDVKGDNTVFNRDPYTHSRGSKPATSHGPDVSLQCALYDFQYVGLGLGVLDLIKFLGTSVESNLLSEDSEMELLKLYYSHLLEYIRSTGKVETGDVYPFDTFMRHWELAVVDWYRFMAGWGFWGNNEWLERRAKEIVAKWTADRSWAF